jgi:hypothetical protein
MELRAIVTRIYDTTKLLPLGPAPDYRLHSVVETPFLHVILLKPGQAGTKPFLSRQLATDLKQVTALGDREEIVIDVRHGFVAIQVPTAPAERGKTVYTSRNVPRGRGLRVVLGLDVMNQPLSFDFAGQLNTNLSFLGVPGSGKSVLMRHVSTSLAAGNTPDRVRFLMIEVAKDGLDLRLFGKLPHLVHPVITEPAEAEAALAWAVTRLSEGLDYRLFIVIDEVAALVSRRPAAIPLLMTLVGQGRAMGIANLLATQLSDRDTLGEGKVIFKQIHNVVLGKAGNAQLSYLLGNRSKLNAESLLGQGDLLLASSDETGRFAGIFPTRQDILALPQTESIARLPLGHYTNTEAVIEAERRPGPDPEPIPAEVVAAGLHSLERQVGDPAYRAQLAGRQYYVLPVREVKALGRNLRVFKERDQVYITSLYRALWRRGLKLCSRKS